MSTATIDVDSCRSAQLAEPPEAAAQIQRRNGENKAALARSVKGSRA